MNNLATIQTKKTTETKIQPVSLNWKDNLSVQKLLDVVVSIMAEEYIEIAKKTPDVFSPHPNPLPYGEREPNGGQK